MPTDSYGQGVPWLTDGDSPNLRTATEGIVSAVTPRSVMRFSNAAARNATITSPVAGMIAWLTTEKLFTGYDGTAWVVLAAGTSSWTNISLASGFSNSDNNDQGNFQYRVVNLFGERTVMLQGGVHVNYSGSPSTIANGGQVTATALPTAARPASLRTITGACSTITSDVLSVKIDAEPSGHIKIVGTTASNADPRIQPPWVSFNGCFYSL